jgi:hypothetical protein
MAGALGRSRIGGPDARKIVGGIRLETGRFPLTITTWSSLVAPRC